MRIAIARVLFLTTILVSGRTFAGTVTTTADSGPGSLREAIASAAAGETIDFAVTGQITLTGGELLLNKDVIISGPGATNLTIQRSAAPGTPDFRIFNIQAFITVTISGLTVIHGSADVGGGINNMTSLTLHDCVVSDNFATGRGGGINNDGELIMSHCTVSGNSVVGAGGGPASGGGVYNAVDGKIVDCIINGNSVTGGPGTDGLGGGIYSLETLLVTNSTVSGNFAIGGTGANGAGGGIFNGSQLSLYTSTVASNLASGASARGGGIDNNGVGATVVVNRCTVSDNIAEGGVGGSAQGGGIANDLDATIESSTVSGNVARVGDGAGASGSALGGGVFNGASSSLVLSHSTITANLVPGGSSPDGGGLLNTGIGFVELKNTILAGNSATFDFVNGPTGDVQSDGFNLIGTTNGPISPGTNDMFNLAARVGPLQDNGGPTFTHALLCGSPAINAGDNTDAPPTDQRGFPRIVGGTIDVGAHEAGGNTPTILRCPQAITTNCVPLDGTAVVNSVEVIDFDGDRLRVLWSVDQLAVQTNYVNATSPPTTNRIDFVATFSVGSHEVAVSISDGGCVETNCSTTVTVTGTPTVTAGNNGPVCAGSSLDLTVSSVMGASYNWTGPDGFSSTLQNPSISNAMPAASGTYAVEVTDTNGCVAGAMTTVVVNSAPTVAAGNNGPICAGSTLRLSASSATAVSYSWSGPNGFTSPVQNPVIANATAAAGGTYTVTVTDANGCAASAATTVTINARGDLYPIALDQRRLAGVPVGGILPDILSGVQPGNFGWLTWAGSPSEPTLVTSLTPPGNSRTYVNPRDSRDHIVSVGDWVQGKPGVTNSREVRRALDGLKRIDITVPVWDRAIGRGNTSLYRVAGFARVRLINYWLPNQNRIAARFLGFVACD